MITVSIEEKQLIGGALCFAAGLGLGSWRTCAAWLKRKLARKPKERPITDADLARVKSGAGIEVDETDIVSAPVIGFHGGPQ